MFSSCFVKLSYTFIQFCNFDRKAIENNVNYDFGTYYKIIEVNHKEISGLDKFLEWLKTDYLETACRGIRKLKAEIIKYEKL